MFLPPPVSINNIEKRRVVEDLLYLVSPMVKDYRCPKHQKQMNASVV